MKILGIDPGTASTGYGIIKVQRGTFHLVTYGCIRTSKFLRPPERLAEIYRDLQKIFKTYRPQIVAVESVYFYKNIKTAIAVAQSRGVVLLATQQTKIPLLELSPLQIKNSLTGYGKADKKQVQYMVKKILSLKTAPKPDDAADALALAICAAGRKI